MATQQPLDAFGGSDSEEGDDFEGAEGVYRWAPAGEPCDRCGTEVTRLWRDGLREVCPDCKEW